MNNATQGHFSEPFVPSTPDQLYVTAGKERRAVALATGLERSSQRIDHLIWFSRLLHQGKGIAAITSADAHHDLGMSRKQWELFSTWLRAEGWAQVEKAYGQGFIWSYGPKWDATNWPAIAAQAAADHIASRSGQHRRSTVKAAAAARSISPQCAMESSPLLPSAQCHSSSVRNGFAETFCEDSDLSRLIPLSDTSSFKDLLEQPVPCPTQQELSDQPPAFPPADLEGSVVERLRDGEWERGYISLWSPDEAWISILRSNHQNIPVETGESCCIYRNMPDAWAEWSLMLHQGKPVAYVDLLAVSKEQAAQSLAAQL